MTNELTGRVVLVTGGGSGIGAACVERYARSGAKVVVVDRNVGEAERVANGVVAAGGVAVSFGADVSDPLQCEAAVTFAVKEMGGLNIAANVAGVGGTNSPIHELSVEDWRRVLSINLDGVFYSMRAELGHMVKNGGGVIVNMGSIYSVVGREKYPDYTVAKHGVLALTRSAAIDYATVGIRVNAVGPAVIRTPLYEQNKDLAGVKTRVDATPAKRVGEANEVANLVVWLSSDEASYITGGYYPVDGGYTAR
jgi:2-dehydro-3-deoxy-L-rhamnonate dehydrogenase (NAD+)